MATRRRKTGARVRTWERRPIPAAAEVVRGTAGRDARGRFVKGNPQAFKEGYDERREGGGRKPGTTLSDAERTLLAQPFPNDPQGRTRAEVLAEVMYIEGVKEKNAAAWRIIKELTEPKEIKVVTWKDAALDAIIRGEISVEIANEKFGPDLSEELFREAGATYRIEAQPEGETDDGSSGQ